MLTEGSVYELLRRDPRIVFDPHIAHAGLIYDDASRALLAGVHAAYIEIARERGLPIIAFADTWRASAARIAISAFRGRAVNRDNLEFLRGVAGES
ncbi:MAG: homocysteine S-methyltransferase family protein, partial [Thermoanaerobaculia bacterium]